MLLTGLSRHRAELDSADEVLLSEDEEKDQRHDIHDAGGHEEIRLAAVDTVEEEHADGQRSEMLALDDDQRPEEAHVGPEECEDRERDEARARQWKNHIPEHLPVGG